METWNSFVSRFDQTYQDVILELRQSFISNFGISDYFGFATLPVDQLATDLASLPDQDPFIIKLATFIQGQAQLATDEAAFLQGWSVDDQPAMERLLEIIPFSEVETNINSITNQLTGQDADQTFWYRYAISLWLRILQTSHVALRTRLHERVGTNLSIGNLLNNLTGKSGYPVLDLADASKSQVAIDLFQNGADDLISEFVDVVSLEASDVYSQFYPEEENITILLSRFPDAQKSVVSAIAKAVLSTQDIAGFQVLTNPAQVLDILENTSNWGPRHSFSHEMAGWLIREAQAVIEQVVAENTPVRPVNYWQDITIQLQAEENLPTDNLLVEVIINPGAVVEEVIGLFRTQGEGRFTVTIPRQYEAGSTSVPQQVQFNIYSTEEDSNPEVQTVVIDPSDSRILIVTQKAPGTPEPVEYAPLGDLQGLTSLQNMAAAFTDVSSALSQLNITNLEEVRQAGGLERLAYKALTEDLGTDLNSLVDNPYLVRLLDAHAVLEAYSPDIEVNDLAIQVLENRGVEELYNLSALTREEFVQDFEALAQSLHPALENPFLIAAELYQRGAVSSAWQLALAGLAASSSASSYEYGPGDSMYETASDEYPITPPALSATILQELANRKCDCETCSTAVSPLAYLAALVKYAEQQVRNNGQLIKASYLQSTLKQPFCELPATCEQADVKVCQTRLAVETLVRYLGGTAPLLTQVQLKSYLRASSDILLRSLGTSSAELNRVFTDGDAEAADALARRIGMSHYKVKILLYQSTLDANLTETVLEDNFGLKESGAYNPDKQRALSRGIFKPISTYPDFLSRWYFTGELYKVNTDKTGFIYVKITRTSLATIVNPAQGDIKIYRTLITSGGNIAGSELIGSGIITAARLAVFGFEYFAEIFPRNDSGLKGRLVFTNDFSANAETWYSFGLFPAVTSARLRNLEREWQAQDHGSDNPFVSGARAVVDPDLMGPADIREPGPTLASNNTIFKLWRHRIEWLENQLTDTDLIPNEPPLYNLVAQLDQVFSYPYLGPTPTGNASLAVWRWGTNDLDTFREFFESGNTIGSFPEAKDIIAIVESGVYETQVSGGPAEFQLFNREKFITDFLKLNLEAYNRLRDLVIKEDTGSGLSDEELTDGRNILLSLVKQAANSQWANEERQLEIYLYPSLFYPPLQAPAEGEWNKRPESQFDFNHGVNIPYIDPQVHSLADLPDPVWGRAHRLLWLNKRDELNAKRDEILAAGQAESDQDAAWLDMLDSAYGSIPIPQEFPQTSSDPDPFEAMYEVLRDGYSTANATQYDAALDFVTQKLLLDLEDYLVLGGNKRKNP